MTSLNPASQIPASINTVEKCAAWSCSILADLNPTTSIVTAPDQAERVAQSFPLYFPQNSPATERLVVVAYLPLPANWRGIGALHKAVNELGTASIPAAYTSP